MGSIDSRKRSPSSTVLGTSRPVFGVWIKFTASRRDDIMNLGVSSDAIFDELCQGNGIELDGKYDWDPLLCMEEGRLGLPKCYYSYDTDTTWETYVAKAPGNKK